MKSIYIAIVLGIIYLYLSSRLISTLSEEDKKKLTTKGVNKWLVLAVASPTVAIPFIDNPYIQAGIFVSSMVTSMMLDPIHHRKLLKAGMPQEFLKKQRLLGLISAPAVFFFYFNYWNLN